MAISWCDPKTAVATFAQEGRPEGCPAETWKESVNQVLEDMTELLIMLHLGLLSSSSDIQLCGEKIIPHSLR